MKYFQEIRLHYHVYCSDVTKEGVYGVWLPSKNGMLVTTGKKYLEGNLHNKKTCSVIHTDISS